MRAIKNGIVILFLCLMLQAGMAYAANCPAPLGQGFKIVGVMWGNSTHQIAAGPGEMDVPLTVTVESFVDQCNLISVEGYLQLYGGVTNFNGTSYAAYFIPTVQPYSTFNMIFNLNLASNVTAGLNATIALPLYISWNYSNSTISRTTQSYTLDIPMGGTPQLSFIVPDRALIAGEDNNLTIEISNTGSGEARSFVPSISLTSSISLQGHPPKIDSIAPNQTRNVTIQLYVSPSLAGQAVNLAFDPHYINPYGYNTTLSTTLNLYALSASESTISVSASKQSLVEGELENVSVIITNKGTSSIDNLSVLMSAGSQITVIGSQTYVNFAELLPGKNVSIPVDLFAAPQSTSSSSTLPPPVATLNVQLSYDGQQEGTPRVLSFVTPGYVDITEVSTTVLPATPTKGGIFSLTSTLNNLGSTAATAAQVTVKPPKGLTIEGANTTFIGSLAADTPTAFTVSFKVSSSANTGTYEIPIVLTYSNNLNQRVNQTLNFSVDVSASNALSDNYITTGTNGAGFRGRLNTGPPLTEIAIAAVVIIAIAAVSFSYWRKTKMVQTK